MLSVLSVGGSIISPEGPDAEFISKFVKEIKNYLKENAEDRLILVCGGGGPARLYQGAYRALTPESEQVQELQDLIGIRATHINAELIKSVFGKLCADPIVINPTSPDVTFTGRILVAGGWKPGFSTDTDAVYLAKRFGAATVINLSNIKKVYTADPRYNKDAKPIDSISWNDFIKNIVGTEWKAGLNAPFDPVASKMASESGIKVYCADGRNLENTLAILKNEPFEGTVIGG